ncbi:hypothetical protein L195_g045008, partial [Trifolium pratense]
MKTQLKLSATVITQLFCLLHRRNSPPLLWLRRLASVSEESCISQQEIYAGPEILTAKY